MSLHSLSPAVPREVVPHCVACKRESGNAVLEMRRLGSNEVHLICVDPRECKRHWPIEDQKGH